MPDMMGCIGSHLTRVMSQISEARHSRSSRRNQNVFTVFNVDELGRNLAPGKLEVTETDLVVHLSGKAPLTWPLRSLRRYGYENDLFSFESGRRCPTGAGIYAFKCHRAQVIFNLLQAKIQIGNLSITLPPAVPANQNGGAESDNLTPVSLSPTFDYVNISEPHHRHQVETGLVDSPTSPLNLAAEGLDLDLDLDPTKHPLYMNVESKKKLGGMVNYQNHPRKSNGHRKLLEGISPSVPLLFKNDLNFNSKAGGGASGGGVSIGGGGSIYYTNVDCVRKPSMTTTTMPTATAAVEPAEVNYAELDLEHSRKTSRGPAAAGESSYSTPPHGHGRAAKAKDSGSSLAAKAGLKPSKSMGYTSAAASGTSGGGVGGVDNGGGNTSPTATTVAGELGYATIDFDRTAALSGVTRTKIKLDFHSASMDKEDESGAGASGAGGARKTRHNSTAL